MSKFNVKTGKWEITENLAGGEAFQENPKLEFVSILLTSFVSDQYYRGEDTTIQRIKELMEAIPDKEFLAKAAVFTRTKYGMRSISHLVAGEIAKQVKGQEWTKDFFDKVIYRPDDMTEILAYYLKNYGKPIPNSLKKGFRQALGRFNEYQLAKYRKEDSAVSLVDVINLVHPTPVDANTEALKKLVEGTLRSRDTWETELTQAGQKAESVEQKEELKRDVWVRLIKERKIGYFALLRNLRNILEQAPGIVDDAIALLKDEKLISKSLVLPFRYISALDEIEQVSFDRSMDVLIALNEAVDLSLKNVPHFDGDTLVVLDCSGSMCGRPSKIGSLFAATLVKTNHADLILFSDDAKYKMINPMDSTITIAKSTRFSTGGTNFHSIFRVANKKYDRIIILSDMQGWIGYDTPVEACKEYKRRTSSDPFIYSFDLAGYGTLQFPERKVFCLAGFSEKVFDTIKFLESDKEAMINEIEKIEL